MVTEPTAEEMALHQRAVEKLRTIVFSSPNASKYEVLSHEVLPMSVDVMCDIQVEGMPTYRVVKLGGLRFAIAKQKYPMIAGVTHLEKDRFDLYVFDHTHKGTEYTAFVGIATKQTLATDIWAAVERVAKM